VGVTRRRFSRRKFLELATAAAAGAAMSWDCAAAMPAGPKARVIIVGGGFAGASCALHLRSANPALEVTLVDPDDRYITCPMSNSVLVGLRALGSITVSRDALERRGVTLARDRVEAIDAQRRQVRLGRGATLAYDRLVMAPGIRFLWGQPQGYDEAAARVMPHAWQAGAQTEILAAQLRGIRSGGVVAISVPAGPMRCPPGPFERAGLMADFLKRRNPRAKILIFDANNHFPKQDLFTDAWQALYPGMIDWIPVVRDGAVVRVAPAEMTIYTSHDAHRADVINIIPPQAPALLAVEAGLASGHGWCPIDPQTFESTLIPYVHVIGDACIADPMPKAASSANAQARQCALAILAALEERPSSAPILESVCYSLLAPDRALSIHGRFQAADGRMLQLPAAAEPEPAAGEEEARNAADWYQRIVADSFGRGLPG
jgi:sulfide dehydrogenase [flavocytochrome c] flavoprotein chain